MLHKRLLTVPIVLEVTRLNTGRGHFLYESVHFHYVYFLYRSGPARNKCQSPKNANLDAVRNKLPNDSAPNKSTAHRVTSSDGLRTPASNEYIEKGHKVPLLDVRLEKVSTDGVVAYYKEGYQNKSTAQRVTSNDDGLGTPAADEYIEAGHKVPILDVRLENRSNDGDVVAYYKEGYPNKSTAHHVTCNDDGLRTPASDEYIEGGHKVPLLDVSLENGSNDGDVVAYYKEGYPNKSTAHRVTSNDDGLRTPAADEYIEGGHEVLLLDFFPELEYIDDDDEVEEEKEKNEK